MLQHRLIVTRLPLALVTLLLLIAGCSLLPGESATPTPAFTPTPATLAEDAARAYLQAWNAGNYAAMYDTLAPSRRATISADQFVARYKAFVAEATIKKVEATLVSVDENGNDAEAKFRVAFDTYAVGSFQQDNTMALRRDDNRWGILWSPSLIVSQLTTGGEVHYYPQTSARADLLDRRGRPLTLPQKQVVVEAVPSEMKNENAVLSALGRVFNLQPGVVKAMYAKYPTDWRTPIGVLTPDQVKANVDALTLPGIHTDTTRDARTYPNGEVGAHVIGYVGVVNADELDQLRVKGYRDGDIIGKSGLELVEEPYLSGERGGKLVVLAPTGAITATLASVPAKQSQNVYTTLDVDMMAIAEKALGKQNGAVVALDVSNGDVLAMVSHPAYDPNKLSGKLSGSEFRALLNDPNSPLLNRATQSALPPGSVFKIVSFSAAVEKGIFAPTSVFNDPGYWDGLGPGYRKFCWVWPTRGKGHGAISLQDALTASCDVTFYQVGAKLDQVDRNLMTTFARAFGLGSPTGVDIPEASGNVPDPATGNWRLGDAINTVIGQGTMLASPIQLADMLAAVANGGTLYRPRLVSRISSVAVGSEKVFQPEVRGKLPISAKTQSSLRDALKGVTTDKEGTATFVFKGDKIISAGKTGTAEVGKSGEPHAWFAGYAPADNPKIALVVMVEHGGEGSKTAAPVFREIVDKYLALPTSVK